MGYELTIAQAAELIGVSRSRISQLVSAGVLISSKSSGRRMISADSATAYRERAHEPGRPVRGGIDCYTLMCADCEVARITYDPSHDYPFCTREVLDPERFPLGVPKGSDTRSRRELNAWWEHRSIPQSRPGLESKVLGLGIGGPALLSLRSLGLSLSDCYWVRPQGHDGLAWENVNYFDNDFVEVAKDDWDWWLSGVGLDSPDNTSEGELPKKWVVRGHKRVLLKGAGINDQPPYNEVVATALHRRLMEPGDYVPYGLVETAGGVACECDDFLAPRESYIPAVYVKNCMGNTRGASVYDRFCRCAGALCGDEEAVRISMCKMIVCDSILANGDRHWRNFGFVRDVDTLAMRPAPIFDSGSSLWYNKTERDVQRGDWSFAARPFGPDPDQQLACVDRVQWFDESLLAGFVDEAADLLEGCSYLQGARRDYVLSGLARRVGDVSAAVRVLAYR